MAGQVSSSSGRLLRVPHETESRGLAIDTESHLLTAAQAVVRYSIKFAEELRPALRKTDCRALLPKRPRCTA